MRGLFLHVLECKVLAAFLVFTGLISTSWNTAGGEPLQVVASIFPVADLVRNVGGEHVAVTVLLPPGASPHTFDPKPSQIRQISEARVLFEIGAGLEHWSSKLAQASGNQDLTTVRLSEGLDLLYLTEHHDHGHGQTEHHANPHVWLDPLHAVSMVERIADVLSDVDPRHRADYLDNAVQYVRMLLALHEEIRQSLDVFADRRYVSFHPAWEYFAQRYGLHRVGLIEESPGREASPRHLRRIIDAIRSYEIKAVFAEPQLNPKAAEVIAGEAGVEVIVLDPIGGAGLAGRDSYVALMRYNVNQMARALGQAQP